MYAPCSTHCRAPFCPALGTDRRSCTILQLLVPVRATSAYECFKEVIPHLWTLWELTTLAEPTIVMATSPHTGSEAVLSLVSLISPVRPPVSRPTRALANAS